MPTWKDSYHHQQQHLQHQDYTSVSKYWLDAEDNDDNDDDDNDNYSEDVPDKHRTTNLVEIWSKSLLLDDAEQQLATTGRRQ